MIFNKRIYLLCGHYGSGKTNIAVNLAVAYKQERDNVAIADLDIVNPYFRTKDSLDLLKEKGIRLIVSEYANSNVDIPALPQDLYPRYRWRRQRRLSPRQTASCDPRGE